jgi:DUF2971 family protein
MTHSGFLNDRSEMREGFALINRVLETTKSIDNTEHGKRWAKVRHDWPRDFSDMNAFVTSFCEKSDTLDLWRAYVRNGGAAIGFSGKALEIEAKKKALWLLPCLYQLEARSERVFEMVEFYTHNYSGPIKDDEEHFSDAVCGDLMMEIPRQKSSHFASECEWRLFVFDNILDQHEKVEFTVSDRGLVPYLSFQFDPSAISEVVVEPLATSEAVFALEQFLASLGYNHVAVRKSSVPLKYQ